MDEHLLTEVFTEKYEVPAELKDRIHEKLLIQERRIMRRNLAVSLTAVIILSFFIVSFAVIFLGSIVWLLAAAAFSVISAVMAVILSCAAGKYEIRNIRKGLV
jgi:hypothetical protein